MKTKLLFFIITTIMMLFTACDNNNKFEEDEFPTTERKLKSSFDLYIGHDGMSGNGILFLYAAPQSYASFKGIEVQFLDNSEWLYYKPNAAKGSTIPYIIYRNYPTQIILDATYLPLGHFTVRFRLTNGVTTSEWSKEHYTASDNKYGFIPSPKIGEGTTPESTTPAEIKFMGQIKSEHPLAYNARITVKVTDNTGKTVSKEYKKNIGEYLYANIGVYHNSVYTIQYTIEYLASNGQSLGSRSGSQTVIIYGSSSYTIHID